MTSCREGLLKQHPHEDQVFVGAIDQNAVALQSFGCKADFLVELDRDHVAFPNRQFYPAQPEGLRSLDMGAFSERARSVDKLSKQLELLMFSTKNYVQLSAYTALL